MLRSNPNKSSLAKFKPIYGIIDSSIDVLEDGDVKRIPQHVSLDLTSKEAADALPSYEEMKISVLEKAGIEIKQVPTEFLATDAAKAEVYGRYLASRVIEDTPSIKTFTEE